MPEPIEKWIVIAGFLVLSVMLGTEGLGYWGAYSNDATHSYRNASTMFLSVGFNHHRQF
jgi:hypothetical protein